MHSPPAWRSEGIYVCPATDYVVGLAERLRDVHQHVKVASHTTLARYHRLANSAALQEGGCTVRQVPKERLQSCSHPGRDNVTAALVLRRHSPLLPVLNESAAYMVAFPVSSVWLLKASKFRHQKA
jgi:hypothetical protein